MKKTDILAWANLLAVPVLIALLGLILLVNPDSIAVIIAKGAGWILVLIGAGFGLNAAFGNRTRKTGRWSWAAVCLACGIWLLCNPLILAKTLGRFLGILLMILGGQDLNRNLKYNGGRVVITPGLILAGAIVLVGLILLVFPMTTSRILFTVCGIVLICVGVAEVVDRVKNRKYLNEGDDSNIIDAL